MVPDDKGSRGGRKERSFSSNLFTVLEEKAIGGLGQNLSRGVGLYNAFGGRCEERRDDQTLYQETIPYLSPGTIVASKETEISQMMVSGWMADG